MKEWRSQAHVKWECKYHVVIVPKYRSKKFFEGRRRPIGEILRELCRQKGLELVEGKAMPDHVHMLLRRCPFCDGTTCLGPNQDQFVGILGALRRIN